MSRGRAGQSRAPDRGLRGKGQPGRWVPGWSQGPETKLAVNGLTVSHQDVPLLGAAVHRRTRVRPARYPPARGGSSPSPPQQREAPSPELSVPGCCLNKRPGVSPQTNGPTRRRKWRDEKVDLSPQGKLKCLLPFNFDFFLPHLKTVGTIIVFEVPMTRQNGEKPKGRLQRNRASQPRAGGGGLMVGGGWQGRGGGVCHAPVPGLCQ